MFIINPPHTLKDALKDTLPYLVKALGQDSNAAHTLESSS
jgi:23S rRNA (adenine2030-N6)-methyltransferase